MILIFCCRDLLKKTCFFKTTLVSRVRFIRKGFFLQIFQKPKQLVLCLWTARSTNSQLATPIEWRAAKRKRGSRRQSRARRRCHAAPEQQRSGARRRRSLQSRCSGGSPRRAMRRHQLATTEAFFTTWDTVGKKSGILSSNVKTPHMIDYHGYLSNQNVSSFILRVIHMPIYVGI